jgi:hypothetical protein
MAAEDVAQALMAMDDPQVRQRIAAGDFEALGTLELTSEEQALVSGATPVLPDGHPSKLLVPFGTGEVEAHGLKPGEDSGYWPNGTAQAIGYVQGELGDPQVQAKFRGWVASRGDEFP